MARVRFTRDYAYKPVPQVTIVYRGGQEYTVKRECADAAVKAGAAVGLNEVAAGDGEET